MILLLLETKQSGLVINWIPFDLLSGMKQQSPLLVMLFLIRAWVRQTAQVHLPQEMMVQQDYSLLVLNRDIYLFPPELNSWPEMTLMKIPRMIRKERMKEEMDS